MPWQGLYLGLSFRVDDNVTLDTGHLTVLKVESGSFSVGGVIPPLDRRADLEEVERRIRACFRRGCPDGLVLPPPLYDIVQKPILRHAVVTTSDDGHLHGIIDGHGSRSAYDLVSSTAEVEGWLVAVDDYHPGLDKVNLYLRTPLQQGTPRTR